MVFPDDWVLGVATAVLLCLVIMISQLHYTNYFDLVSCVIFQEYEFVFSKHTCSQQKTNTTRRINIASQTQHLSKTKQTTTSYWPQQRRQRQLKWSLYFGAANRRRQPLTTTTKWPARQYHPLAPFQDEGHEEKAWADTKDTFQSSNVKEEGACATMGATFVNILDARCTGTL